jgi:H+/Cl- antiporter ClcA
MKVPLPPFLKVKGLSSNNRLLPYNMMIGWAVVIGLFGGLIATAYFLLLNGGLHLIWDVVAPAIEAHFLPGWARVATVVGLTTAGGFLVGATMKWMKSPGEISAVVNNIHIRQGKMNRDKNPSMLVNSLFSIVFGGSAGPEAPLVQLVGSGGSWLGEKLRLHGDLIRTFTLCGMAAALGAFFGAPIGGALFALEIPHKRGLEYYEALIPSVVAAVAAFLVFKGLVGYQGSLYPMTEVVNLSFLTVAEGLLLGVIGAGLAILFINVFRWIKNILYPLNSFPLLLGGTGGLAIGLLALLIPADFPVTALFWSEYQTADLINSVAFIQDSYTLWGAVGLLGLLAVVKMASIGFTLHSGFRGGFIFPLFFIGAASGLALSLATGQAIPATVAMIGLMAAVNVGVTKTPISTSVILISLSGVSLFPVVAVSSIVSYLCTEKVRLINTQQHRTDNRSPMHRVWRWKEP